MTHDTTDEGTIDDGATGGGATALLHCNNGAARRRWLACCALAIGASACVGSDFRPDTPVVGVPERVQVSIARIGCGAMDDVDGSRGRVVLTVAVNNLAATPLTVIPPALRLVVTGGAVIAPVKVTRAFTLAPHTSWRFEATFTDRGLDCATDELRLAVDRALPAVGAPVAPLPVT